MSVIHNDLLLSTDEATGYNLTKSLRFRSSASAYLSKTFSASPTSATKQTFSIWLKRGSFGQKTFFGGYDGSAANSFYIEFNSSDSLKFAFGGTTVGDLITSAVYRDPAAFYHIVVAVDTTQATASNRVKLYVNGSQVTAFGTANYPSQNATMQFAMTNANNRIGAIFNNTGNFDGYITDAYFIDGQQLTPSSFGETDSITGVWKPKAFVGTYGTNGFYLPFTDVATTSGSNAGLGKDFSGNGNYWTTNNISVTAGVTYDSMSDVPTLTSATQANYATFNPLNGNPATGALADGNLTGTSSSNGEGYWNSTIAIPTTGKWYWEFQFTTGGSGIRTSTTTSSMGSYAVILNENGRLYVNGSDLGIVASGYASTDIMGIAVDTSATTIKWYKNNTLNYTYTYTAQSLPMFAFGGKYSSTSYINFGQRGFVYTPPTSHLALNTYNLPTSTIVKGNTVMDSTTYTGNGSTQSITNAAGFKPDLVWIKNRTGVYNHRAFDSIRGATKILYPNATDAELTDANSLTSFNSNGFSLGSAAGTNNNTDSFVGWQWQAGQGTTSSNTSGTITSTVSVNASAGFSVVTFANTSTGSTIGHGLGVTPSMIIIKDRGSVSNWQVYHSSLGNTVSIRLNLSDAQVTGSNNWNNTSPTSSVFTLGSGFAGTFSYVAYCWSEIAGFSKFGSYTGNGSADGPFIYTGFRPKFVLIKRTDTAQSWQITDSSRDTYNVATNALFPNTVAVEGTGYLFDLLSNGFKIKEAGNNVNASGGTYIYACFAESPFKVSLAR
jgi:hypothetical protein